jgi:uncharacterized protein (TIGR04255 family)
MTIKFPVKTEIKLNKSPLDEVIFQVKFPAILRIMKDSSPAEFQELIRERFPVFGTEHGIRIQISGIDGSDKPIVESISPSHRFLTSDKKSYISLASDFYALGTKQYTHWSNFQHDMDLVTSAVQQIYQPSYTTRIGLRFVNKFTKKNTGCNNFTEILDLFRTELTCLLRTKVWSGPTELLTQIILTDGTGKLAVRSGSGRDQNGTFFVLDFDYFEEGQLPLDKLDKRIERYHSKIYNAFRWCLLDESLNHFEPFKEI